MGVLGSLGVYTFQQPMRLKGMRQLVREKEKPPELLVSTAYAAKRNATCKIDDPITDVIVKFQQPMRLKGMRRTNCHNNDIRVFGFQQPMRLKGMRQRPYFLISKQKVKDTFREPPQQGFANRQKSIKTSHFYSVSQSKPLILQTTGTSRISQGCYRIQRIELNDKL